MPRMQARERLAVALDVPDLTSAEALIRALDGVPGWLKVGPELFTAAGPAAVAAAARAARVFLDLKLHDIPHTVAAAVGAAVRQGAAMLTLHTMGGRAMLRAAREAAERAAGDASPPLLVGVTLLTSLGPSDLEELGVAAASVEEQVVRLVELALAEKLDGVVASPLEAALIRRRAGDALTIVTPGVRPADWPADDQTRTRSAAEAIAAGSDLLVVGRPVVRARRPAEVARRLVREIEDGLGARHA